MLMKFICSTFKPFISTNTLPNLEHYLGPLFIQSCEEELTSKPGIFIETRYSSPKGAIKPNGTIRVHTS